MKVLRYPLTQITFLFVFGILFNRYLNVSFNVGLMVLVVAFFLFVCALLVARNSTKRIILHSFTFSTLLLSFVLGNFTAILHQETNDPNHYSYAENSVEREVSMKVILLERWKPTAKNQRFLAEIYSINDSIASGKILLNFRNEQTSKPIHVGSKLAVHAKIIKHSKPMNPDQFDYGAFLQNKSIYGQAYVDDNSISIFNSKQKNLYYYSAIFRNRVITNLKNSGFNAKELAVVNALILGQRQDLDPTVLQNYQFAGAIHLLSVSGLHVGFVLLFLNYFLNLLPNSNRYRVFKVITVIFILWCFALVAGFSPSVVRSVTMFSFVAIGMYMKRKTYVFNTFFCSIFLILLFEPSFLFDVGFQLSYMALFFILWLQPEFAKIWKPKYKVVNYFWQVFTITFAAQLGTMPLSLYYFHQFPGLFFVTNLLVMFLMTIIMGVGLFLVLIAFWTEIPTFMAKILEKLIWLLNYLVEQIASFESFIFKDISFNFWMMLALYFTVFAIGWFCIKQNFRNLGILLVSILLLQMSWMSFDYASNSKQELLVFQERYGSLILERNGSEVSVFSNKIDSNAIRTDRNIQSFNVANGTRIKEVNKIPELLFFSNKRILILDSTSVPMPEMKPHVLIITQSPKINFERLINDHKPEIVIADASNYKNVVESIRKSCEQQKIPFHAIAEKGFYKIEN